MKSYGKIVLILMVCIGSSLMADSNEQLDYNDNFSNEGVKKVSKYIYNYTNMRNNNDERYEKNEHNEFKENQDD